MQYRSRNLLDNRCKTSTLINTNSPSLVRIMFEFYINLQRQETAELNISNQYTFTKGWPEKGKTCLLVIVVVVDSG